MTARYLLSIEVTMLENGKNESFQEMHILSEHPVSNIYLYVRISTLSDGLFLSIRERDWEMKKNFIVFEFKLFLA